MKDVWGMWRDRDRQTQISRFTVSKLETEESQCVIPLTHLTPYSEGVKRRTVVFNMIWSEIQKV
jgi:hypothetical protein